MGDVAMCVHALLAVRRAYPGVELFMLSRKRFQPIFEQVPGLTFISADDDGIEKGLMGTITLALRLRKQRFDTVVDLHDVIRTKIIRALVGSVKTVIDKGRAEKRQFVANAVRDKFLPSTHNRYLSAFAKANLGKKRAPLRLTAEDVLEASPLGKPIQETLQVSPKNYVILAPFAAHESKSLSREKAAEAIQILMECGLPILLLGGGARETGLLDVLAGQQKSVTNIAGRFTFQEELEIISNARFMVAMDSGNGHLAALYGVPVATIWGATHPSLGFAPYFQKPENWFFPDFEKFQDLPDTVFGKGSQYGTEVTDSVSLSRLSEMGS